MPQLPVQPVEVIAEPVTLTTALCTQCGLCCSGAIHTKAILEPEEVQACQDMGLDVRVEDRPVFALPCPKLADRKCTIFGSRPQVCGGYSCNLRDDVEEGVKSLDEALAIVAQAHALFADAIRRDGLPASPTQMHLVVAGKDASVSPEERLRTIVFQLFLDRHFRTGKDLLMFKTPAVDGPDDRQDD